MRGLREKGMRGEMMREETRIRDNPTNGNEKRERREMEERNE